MQGVEKSAIRKITCRIVLYCGFLFFLNYIDRVNVSFAALQMNAELGFTPSVYGLASGIFFISYAALEIPSNLALQRFGPRLWLSRIAITWGIVSACFALIHESWTFYLLRFLLGAAEAGFVPGVILYFSYWLPPRYRGKFFGSFFAISQISSIVGAPLSGLILDGMHGLAGVSGWRWLFVVEGVPSILVGVLSLFVLVDKPADARWLTDAERQWLARELQTSAPKAAVEVRHVFTDPRVWTLISLYFFFVTSGYGLTFWLPLIIKNLGALSPTQIGLLASLPPLCALLALIGIGWNSDRLHERRLHVAISAFIGGIAMLASAFAGSPVLSYILVCLAAAGIFGQNGVFWTLPANYLSPAVAAAGLAFINSVAQVGGFAGPYLVGWLREASGGFGAPLMLLASSSLVVAAIATFLLPRDQPRAVAQPAVP
ncbi:MAG: MFS transporter [Pseudomonadota bacterium]|jgi:sugar phosphate permease